MLADELQELPIHIKIFNKESSVPIRRVTKVDTICDVMKAKESSKECMPILHKLLQLNGSVPLASATAERTFSAMRRIKSWLRSKMTAYSLSNRMFAVIHKQRVDDINTEQVAKDFIATTERHQNFRF